jgi:uncharacterized protein (TIGR02145 family)
MCHNLGANESLDPFVWNAAGNPSVDNDTTSYDIKGWLFQWGRFSDGHQYRSSAQNTDTRPSVSEYNAAVTDYKSSSGTAIPYTAFWTRLNTTNYDWVSNTDDTAIDADSYSRWGAGTSTEASTAKTQNDPCPPGWKVPSQSQWGSIFWGGMDSGAFDKVDAANTITKVNDAGGTFRGYKVGDALFLPAAGARASNNGSLENGNGVYWSSTWLSNTNTLSMHFNSSNITSGRSSYRAGGFSVRCVAE